MGEQTAQADMLRTHSWIGMSMSVLFLFNYVMGSALYAVNAACGGVPAALRRQYLPVHVVLGSLLIILAYASISSGMAEVGPCAQGTDGNRGWTYGDMTKKCKLGNSLVATSCLCSVCTFFALSIPAHKSLQTGSAHDKPLHTPLR